MKNIKGCLLHNSDNWKTPKELYSIFIDQNSFVDCFPFNADYDEFLNSYYKKNLFINPPFSKLSSVCDWIINQYINYCNIWVLIPSRTDTKYFHKLVESCWCDIYFLKGRLHFNDSVNPSPFPTMLIHLNCNIHRHNFFLVDNISKINRAISIHYIFDYEDNIR